MLFLSRLVSFFSPRIPLYPYLLHFGSLVLPTFGVLAAVGLMLALGLSERTARLAHISPEALWNAGLFAVLAAFVLSRVLLVAGHWQAFVAYPLLLLTVPSLTAAGLLATLAVTALYLWRKHIQLLSALDAWSPCATLVWFFLALGHFAEGSDPGMPSAHGLRLPGDSLALQPVALYAAAVAAVLTPTLYRVLARSSFRGQTAAVALIVSGIAQFLLCFVRQPGLEQQGLETLEWVSLTMIVAGAVLLLTAPAMLTDGSHPSIQDA